MILSEQIIRIQSIIHDSIDLPEFIPVGDDLIIPEQFHDMLIEMAVVKYRNPLL